MLRLLNKWFRKSKTVNNEPINKISLIVIILIDIFILINVFIGLADISNWYISPSQANQCYAEWQNYQVQTTKDKDYEIIKKTLLYGQSDRLTFQDNQSDRLTFQKNYQEQSFQKNYQEISKGHLGNISTTCLKYAVYQDKINDLQNQQIIATLEQTQLKIEALKQANNNIRAQYDSTLLEKIANQPQNQSINQVSAEKAKQELEQNNQKISIFEKETSKAKKEIITKPESASFISFLNESGTFREVESSYQQASFWYPSIRFAFQAIFLLPLIFIALIVHTFAQRKHYGLISLISWHLLVIFLIPLILKIFEFLQVGVVFQFLRDVLSFFFGGLLFLISYLYILLVPVIGFGIIKFFQRIVFNPKIQATNRFQKSCCIKCAKKIRNQDVYCTHCGYYQYTECQNCHNLTYQSLPFCKDCGHPQDSGTTN